MTHASSPEEAVRLASEAVAERTGVPAEETLRRRARRARTRRRAGRVTLVGVVLLSTLGGTMFLDRAFRGTQPVDEPPGSTLVSLWPEHDTAVLAAAQAAADAGDAAATWRTDPRQVGIRFSEQILGWTDPRVRVDAAPWTPSGGDPHIRVGACPSSGCPSDGPTFTETLVLVQLGDGGPTGAWSVVAAEAGDLILDPLDMGVGGDLTLVAGRRLDPFTMSSANGGLPDGTPVRTGTMLWGRCAAVTQSETHTVWFRYAHFRVASIPDMSCGGGPEATTSGGAGAVFLGWPAEATDAVIARLTGTMADISGTEPVQQLSIYAVSIESTNDSVEPLPAYLDQDPSTLPPCLLAVGPPTSDGEAMPPRPYGVGIAVDVKAANPPCLADVRLTIDIVRGDGQVVPVEGERTAHVRGPIPSYEPDGSPPAAFWRLGDWCPPLGEGPYEVRVSAELTVLRQVHVAALDDLCTERSADGQADPPRPPEGRGTPSLDVMSW